jgi:hypothetical protein
MKAVLTNASNDLFKDSRVRLNESAQRFGIGVNSYDLEEIRSTLFYAENRGVLDSPKGIGYWLWKPYIVLETMRNLQDGDVVIYSDCGHEIIASLDPLIQICANEQPVLLFANGDLRNSMFTKMDCFLLMDCNTKKYWRGTQADASFALFRKSPEAIKYLKEWMKYGRDIRIISSNPNTLGKKNKPDFVEHRWDQSIMSLLAIRHQIPYYRVPSQYGNHYKLPAYRVPGEFNQLNQYQQQQVDYYAEAPFENSPYGQLLNHHRTKRGPVVHAPKKTIFTNLSARIKRKVYHFWVWIDERVLNG